MFGSVRIRIARLIGAPMALVDAVLLIIIALLGDSLASGGWFFDKAGELVSFMVAFYLVLAAVILGANRWIHGPSYFERPSRPRE